MERPGTYHAAVAIRLWLERWHEKQDRKSWRTVHIIAYLLLLLSPTPPQQANLAESIVVHDRCYLL